MFDAPQLAAIGLGALIIGAVETKGFQENPFQEEARMDGAKFVAVSGRHATDTAISTTSLGSFAQVDEGEPNGFETAIVFAADLRDRAVFGAQEVWRALED
ncbi:hypothetical protein [uncultured Maritimibacter sp.]|jgi:hypothetical protein|uniref:hypothetical protein n=1 Tax=uncultured Maritimibacter sp. TaxID=991866 RepID=UPI000AE12E41|nr:hypothetical protein [uncultured Maritimibacter sp.]